MKKVKKVLGILIVSLSLIFGTEAFINTYFEPIQVEAASKVKLNKTTLTLKKGKAYQLKVSGTKKKISWKSSKKSVAKVSAKGKVTANKTGKTVITAQIGQKKYTCKITVKIDKTEQEREEVLKSINRERGTRGLSKLKLDNTLNEAANTRAKEIAKKFSHTRPNGKSCFSILNEKKYQISRTMSGENIAAGQTNAAEVMTSWMNSSGHKANILTEEYDRVGIGYYYNSDKPYQYYWVQIFVKLK